MKLTTLHVRFYKAFRFHSAIASAQPELVVSSAAASSGALAAHRWRSSRRSSTASTAGWTRAPTGARVKGHASDHRREDQPPIRQEHPGSHRSVDGEASVAHRSGQGDQRWKVPAAKAVSTVTRPQGGACSIHLRGKGRGEARAGEEGSRPSRYHRGRTGRRDGAPRTKPTEPRRRANR